MAKVYGLNGKMGGRIGNTVMAVVHGEQIGRIYQPYVANPKTAGQIESRAKLKLLSQVGASIAPIIAIRRNGLVSPRNTFIRANYGYVGYVNEEATINMADILITDSVVGLGGFIANRSDAGLVVNFSSSVINQADAIVYVVLGKSNTNQIIVLDSALEKEAGVNGDYRHQFSNYTGQIAVLAYGIRYNESDFAVKLGNMSWPDATDVANLYVSLRENTTSAVLTETRGLYMADGVNSGSTTGTATFSVAISTYNRSTGFAGGGTVTGDGTYAVNSGVTVTATPDSGERFYGWTYPNSSDILSTDTTYTFVLRGNTNLRAVFSNA